MENISKIVHCVWIDNLISSVTFEKKNGALFYKNYFYNLITLAFTYYDFNSILNYKKNTKYMTHLQQIH